MSKGLTPGAVLTDFRLDDDEGRSRTLSELQGTDAMVLQLGRGEHCPRERAHHHELLRLQQLVPVAFTTMVTVLPNDQHDTHKMKIATGAWWTFLSDADLVVQRALDIEEYTDTHHAATVPHTVVLAPGLVVDKVYCGYWFWGRPSSDQLWEDLRDLFRRTKADFDPTTPEARAAWAASLRPATPARG
jgi:peroxiredoxin